MDNFLHEMAPIILGMAAMPFISSKNYFWFLFAIGLAIYSQFYGLQ